MSSSFIECNVSGYINTNAEVPLLFWRASHECVVPNIHRVDDSEPRQSFSCCIQGEVIGFQVLLDSLHLRSTRASWWSPPVVQGGTEGGPSPVGVGSGDQKFFDFFVQK